MSRQGSMDGVFVGLGFAALIASGWMFISHDGARPADAKASLDAVQEQIATLETRIAALQSPTSGPEIIGFVDMREVVLADKQLQKDRDQIAADGQLEDDKFKKTFASRFAEVEKALRTNTVGEEEWRTASRDLLKARLEMLEKQNELRQDFMDKGEQLKTAVDARVRAAIAQTCKEQGITVALRVYHPDADESSRSVSFRMENDIVLYAREQGRDITKRVIELLNKKE